MLKTFEFIVNDVIEWSKTQAFNSSWHKQGLDTQCFYVDKSQDPRYPVGMLLLSKSKDLRTGETQYQISSELKRVYEGFFLDCSDCQFARLLLDSNVTIERSGSELSAVYNKDNLSIVCAFWFEDRKPPVIRMHRAFLHQLGKCSGLTPLTAP